MVPDHAHRPRLVSLGNLRVLLIVYFLVFARVIAETGIPFNQAGFDTGVIIGHTLGFSAVGPASLVMMIFLGGVLNPDARECLTPYFANTFKIAEKVGVTLPKILIVGAGVTIFAFTLGFFAQTYSIYDKGAHNDGWAVSVSSVTFDLITKDVANLKDTGQIETAAATTGLAKIGLIKNNAGHGKQLKWLAFGWRASSCSRSCVSDSRGGRSIPSSS